MALKNILKVLKLNENKYKLKDQYRIGVALKCHEFYATKGSEVLLTPDDVDEFYDSVGMMNENDLTKYIHEEISKQMVGLFTSLKDEKPTLPFSVHCKQSNLKNAGDGLFVKTSKTIMPGALICLYPGLVHLKEHIKDKKYFESLLPDPEYMLMVRNDQSIIDGRTAHLTKANPYAFGQKINHCGSKMNPNVLQVSYDFPGDLFSKTEMEEELRELIPNQYAKPPSFLGKLETLGIMMKGVAMISSRPIKNEDEILMDYKLNPDSKNLPSWYEPFDVEDSRDRWSQS